MSRIFYLAEAILQEAATWAAPDVLGRPKHFLYDTNEPNFSILFALDRVIEADRSISDEFLDELIKLRDEDYFEKGVWEDDEILDILPWFEQKREERDAVESQPSD